MKRFAALLVSASAAAAGCTAGAPTPDVHGFAGLPVFEGRVAVMDGRTLWYPRFAQKVRLKNLDTCELPQWAIDPEWKDREHTKSPAPVPCGPLAKAWLKRLVGGSSVRCVTTAYAAGNLATAYCSVGGRDLGAEMLQAGWARVNTPHPSRAAYLSAQHHAMAARYGMWKTYVLDMEEWRRKARDKTLDRKPIADFNLLAERENEISPPFRDARRRPERRDR